MSKKLNNAAVDFQPDAVEIAMRPLPLPARLGVWFGIVVFFTALAASYFCQVDVIVEGSGKLVSVNQNIVMKPLDRSVIKSIDVKVGQVVKKGQLLISFDPTINKAEEERLINEMQSIDAQYERWYAEFSDNDYKLPAKPTQKQVWQLAIFNQRRAYFLEKLRYFDESIKRIEANIRTTKDTLKTQRERYKAMDEISKMYEDLHKRNATAKKEMLEIRMSRMQLEADISKLENTIKEAEHEKESTEASRQTFVMEWKKDISEQLVAAEQSRTTIRKSLDKVLRLNEYIELRAPCEAIVHEIASFPVGSAVREAEALITLVPIDCDIELEAEIPAKDIGRVKVGDSVRVKLNAFPFQKHGTLDGKIRTISEDTFQKDNVKQENEKIAAGAYYRARIPLSGKLRNIHANFRLIPGMESQAEIKVGTRRVIEYIIHPLVKSLDEAIREP
ncbi:MAG: HlyD family type I secretion periplasmic adaptor subunit [Lentisphaeria bacterium]|nr:HlyD family type I secretion periplasmic adaptor subunit [Lentisphaeria bacterium]